MSEYTRIREQQTYSRALRVMRYRLRSAPAQRLWAARRLGTYDGVTDTPRRALEGWTSEEIDAWLEAWRASRA